jgi:hypothetical protein
MKSVIIVLVGLLITQGGVLADDDRVPFGSGILPNGFIGEGEWDSGLHVELGERVILMLMQDSTYLYIGIHSTDTLHTGIDLFLQTDRTCAYKLHISSAHGQSEMCDTAWSVMDFCENRRWTSNIVESIFVDGKNKHIAPEIFEYQIDKDMLPGDTIKTMVRFKRPEKYAPPGADPDSSESWKVVTK